MDGVMERFERVYEEHRDAVRAYVRRRAPEPLVEDVVSDVFVVCLRRIDDVPRNALPWLYGVARKTLANERRKRRDVPLAPELSYEPEPVGDLKLAGAFAALSDADREILRLVAGRGCRFAMPRACSTARRSPRASAITARRHGCGRASTPLRRFDPNRRERRDDQ
jgi:RNA polymerase sigma-70 factor (ECF subfamily)